MIMCPRFIPGKSSKPQLEREPRTYCIYRPKRLYLPQEITTRPLEMLNHQPRDLGRRKQTP